MRAALFADPTVKFRLPVFEIDSALQGQEGLDLIKQSLLERRPYALAFVDVRTPVGLDGVENDTADLGNVSRFTSSHLHGLF